MSQARWHPFYIPYPELKGYARGHVMPADNITVQRYKKVLMGATWEVRGS